MGEKIRIVSGEVSMTATLNGSETSAALVEVLLVKSAAQRWGDEVYFLVPVAMEAENAQAEVPPGTIAYWPEGPAFCIFFGQTPYSAVNVLGTVDGDASAFGAVADGDAICIEKV